MKLSVARVQVGPSPLVLGERGAGLLLLPWVPQSRSAIGALAAPPQPNEVPAVRTLEQGDQVTGVAFSPDGAKLATAGCCRLGRELAQVKVWSSRTVRCCMRWRVIAAAVALSRSRPTAPAWPAVALREHSRSTSRPGI